MIAGEARVALDHVEGDRPNLASKANPGLTRAPPQEGFAMSMTPDRVLALTELVLRLGEVERVPTHPNGQRHETDTTHSVMLALVAAEVAQNLGLNPGRAALFALVHDLPEAICGDVDTSHGLNAAQRAAKAAAEGKARNRIFADLGGHGTTVAALLAYEEREVAEARLVALLDKAMPKAVRLLQRQIMGTPAPDDRTDHAAASQAVRLRAEFPEHDLHWVHELSDELRRRLFAEGPTP